MPRAGITGKEQAGVLSSQLRDLGCEVIEIPFIEIRKPKSFRPLDRALGNLATYDWLILTSVNGVEALFERMTRRGWARRIEASQDCGDRSQKGAIEKHGLSVTATPKEYVAESVVSALRGRVTGKRMLLVRAKVARMLFRASCAKWPRWSM